MRVGVLMGGGSSPLARGPPSSLIVCEVSVGLIPARAGTTWWCRAAAWFGRAHPRSRGDHPLDGLLKSRLMGSSPLARGPRYCRAGEQPRRGLIPARAGTTVARCSYRTRPRAHPRSRGDHQRFQGHRSSQGGSSPLARGPLSGKSFVMCV